MKKITQWEEKLIQPKQKTFQDVINFKNQLNAQLLTLKGYIDVAEPKVTQGAKERYNDLLQLWKGLKQEQRTIIQQEMAGYNELYKSLDLPAIIMEE